MAKMAPMTKRDKLLVFVLIILVTFAFSFIFLIYPMIETHMENSTEIAELQDRKDSEDELIAGKALLELQLEKYNQDLLEDGKDYYKFTESWEAEREITALTSAHNLIIQSIALTEPYSFAVTGDALPGVDSRLKCCMVNIECQGTASEARAFVATIEASGRKVYIDNWTYSDIAGRFNATMYIYAVN